MNYNNKDESTVSEHYTQDSYEVEQVIKNIGNYNLADIMSENEIDKKSAIVKISLGLQKDFGGDFEKILEEVNNQLN